jgi:hypothetical protein
MAKDVYNRLEFSFSEKKQIVAPIQDAPFLRVQVNIPKVSAHTDKYNEIMNDLNTPRNDNSLPTIDVPPSENSADKLISYSRLATCAKNPLQIADGYVCNNIPQEFSRFGHDLLKTAITIRTILVMGNTISSIKRSSSQLGTISSAKPATRDLFGASIVAASAMIFSSGDVAEELFDTMGGIGFSTTDEFGYIDSNKINEWLSLPIIGGIIALSTQSSESIAVKSVDMLLVFMLIFGVFFAFVLPLVPMLMVISAITKFMFLLCKCLLMTGKKLVDAIFDMDEDVLSEKVDSIWADWLSTALKLPLTVIGVVLAWLMSNVIIAHVLNHMDLTVASNDSSQGFVDMIIVILVSLLIIGVIYNMVLTIIESFYEFTVEWILGELTNSPFSDKKAVGWQDSKDILHMLGR